MTFSFPRRQTFVAVFLYFPLFPAIIIIPHLFNFRPHLYLRFSVTKCTVNRFLFPCAFPLPLRKPPARSGQFSVRLPATQRGKILLPFSSFISPFFKNNFSFSVDLRISAFHFLKFSLSPHALPSPAVQANFFRRCHYGIVGY